MKEKDNDQKAWDAFWNPDELYRLCKEEENLLAGQFLANKYHWGDEKNGIFINPDKAREIYEEIGESYEDWDEQTTKDYELKKIRFIIHGKSEELELILNIYSDLESKFQIEDDNKEKGIPSGILISLLVGSPYYEGIVRPFKHIPPDFIVVEAEMENPDALLFAFREDFPNLRIVEESQLKTDGRGMQSPIGDFVL